MTSTPVGYDLPQLASHASVSIRTVRYYIQQGLLPSPDARGPGAHYTKEHLERLRLIKRLQREHLPLAEIRRILENWSTEGKRWETAAAPKTAKDYIRSVLGKSPDVTDDDLEDLPMMDAMQPNIVMESAEDFPRASPAQAPPPSTPTTRSQWERISLAADIELHIRRPLARDVNKKLERLLEAAREILKENE